MEKPCSKCGGVFPATTEFFRKATAPGALRSECHACRSKHRRERYAKRFEPPAPKVKPTERACSQCQRVFPYDLTYFPPFKPGLFGLRAECRECNRQRHREKRQRDPERYRKINRDAYFRNLEHSREISRINARKSLARQRAAGIQRSDAARERDRQYQQRNKIILRPKKVLYAHARRARKFNAEGTYTQQEWRDKLALYNNKCHWCGEEIKGTPTADHVIPLVHGGTNYIENIVPACRVCNSKKHTKLPWEFAPDALIP